MSLTNSEILQKKSNLLKECADAYAYAVEVVCKESFTAEAINQSCTEICRNCAKECAALGSDPQEDRVYAMCMEYASLCEELLKYNNGSTHERMRKSI
ncbi:hypothetical protein [Halobacillus sp. BBL2006]|uniref:hypothetical protein n=1 Tax=Halobacillus sp. BBL2006 TaxID=1543706 RepID=UPI0005443408|nr:hypothetical protein [Halobacillus sp. BBL2006]KHE72524.1 hypothetical protein LD39_04080 [Halobacillus sp. BBL2006]